MRSAGKRRARAAISTYLGSSGSPALRRCRCTASRIPHTTTSAAGSAPVRPVANDTAAMSAKPAPHAVSMVS